MPEGPELRHSRDALKRIIEGKTILDASPGLSGRYTVKPPVGFKEFKEDSSREHFKVEQIATKGKFMWWKLTSSQKTCYMHCTYGMSAGWFRTPTKHTAFIFEYGDGSKLFFNDIRHFGTIKFVHTLEEHTSKLATLGPCILGGGVTPEIFAENVLKKPGRTIAEALMDQSCVSGVGNYLKAEALYRSGISPWRIVTEISPNEFVTLCQEVIASATESYRSQGATIKTYKTMDGSSGSAQFQFRVYSLKNCPLDHPIRHEETPEGRTSWWCDQCQK